MIKSYALSSGIISVSRGSANKRLTVQPTETYVCVAWYNAQLEKHSVTHPDRQLARGTDIPIPLKNFLACG
jgi:hypothetical protein